MKTEILQSAFRLTDTQPDIRVQESEYSRLLGYPAGHSLSGRPRQLADLARKWYTENGRPWIYARTVDGVEFGQGQIVVEDAVFSSSQLHDQFASAEVHNAVLLAVSAGRECELRARELWQEGKPDEYFFLEMFGSAVTEHLIAVASGRICAWADESGMAALSHYSPGYTGWDIADQTRLWGLLRKGINTMLPGALQVLDSGMLQPKKSQLALVGIANQSLNVQQPVESVPCTSCSLERCQYRRVPYTKSLPQIEEIQRLQPRAQANSHVETGHSTTSNRAPKYSLNGRALRKWSQERLQLKSLPDGSLEARFLYEGTTCSSMGRPLAYEYNLKLSSAESAYVINDADCTPVKEDIGHTLQCEYINNAESLMRATSDEKPLLGQPLSNVFAWDRPYSPSGCYCDAARRLHKWGVVLEVVHYALAQRERALQTGEQSGVSTVSGSS